MHDAVPDNDMLSSSTFMVKKKKKKNAFKTVNWQI